MPSGCVRRVKTLHFAWSDFTPLPAHASSVASRSTSCSIGRHDRIRVHFWIRVKSACSGDSYIPTSSTTIFGDDSSVHHGEATTVSASPTHRSSVHWSLIGISASANFDFGHWFRPQPYYTCIVYQWLFWIRCATEPKFPPRALWAKLIGAGYSVGMKIQVQPAGALQIGHGCWCIVLVDFVMFGCGLVISSCLPKCLVEFKAVIAHPAWNDSCSPHDTISDEDSPSGVVVLYEW